MTNDLIAKLERLHHRATDLRAREAQLADAGESDPASDTWKTAAIVAASAECEFHAALVAAWPTISRVLREAAEGWRPIETAPKDGTWFLAWRGSAPSGSYWTNPVTIRWFVFEEEEGGAWCWPDTIYEVLSDDGIERANSLLVEGDCYDDNTNFTHWRPLPTPPAGEG